MKIITEMLCHKRTFQVLIKCMISNDKSFLKRIKTFLGLPEQRITRIKIAKQTKMQINDLKEKV